MENNFNRSTKWHSNESGSQFTQYNSHNPKYNKENNNGNGGFNKGSNYSNQQSGSGYKQNNNQYNTQSNTAYNSYERRFGGDFANSSSSSSSNVRTIKKTWKTRYNRDGTVRKFILDENEAYFEEHIESLKKRNNFDFENLTKIEMISLFKGRKVDNPTLYDNFSELTHIHSSLQENLKRLSFSIMTPIQKHSIGFIDGGSDLMGCAQTGSGKTIAFLLPIVNKMLQEGPPNDSDIKYNSSAPVALIIVPTRELAEQIFIEARKLLNNTGIEVTKIYGGVGHDTQIRDLKNGMDIIVATPGRLIDFIDSKLISLKKVKYLIIDEADRILDMGFEIQLNTIIFEKDLPEKSQRQNLMFSATFADSVRECARQFMNDYYYISRADEGTNNKNIKHQIFYLEEDDKLLHLHGMLQTLKGLVIIFLDTKKGVDALHSQLNRANYNCTSIHGDKPQEKRKEAIEKFKNGEVPILIATDVASRGLDFPNVAFVFNYDLPTNIDDYVHRVGRSGRCGNTGNAVSFYNSSSNHMILKDLYNLFVELNQEIPDWFKEEFNNGYYNGFSSGKGNYRPPRTNKSSSSGFYNSGNAGYKKNESTSSSSLKNYASERVYKCNSSSTVQVQARPKQDDDLQMPRFFNSKMKDNNTNTNAEVVKSTSSSQISVQQASHQYSSFKPQEIQKTNSTGDCFARAGFGRK